MEQAQREGFNPVIVIEAGHPLAGSVPGHGALVGSRPTGRVKGNPKAGKYPVSKSIRQRVDTVAGVLMEDLECGHAVPTPFTSLEKPYTPGVNRRCGECFKILNKPAPKGPKPLRDEATLDALMPGFQVFPISRQISGVYCLMRQGRVMYVGQSINLLARLGTHVKRYRKRFDAIKFLPVPKDQLNQVEGTLIRALRPPLNLAIPSEIPVGVPPIFPPSENPTPDFQLESGVNQ